MKDKTIELPPLPEPFTYTRPGKSEGALFHVGHMRDYARAAVEADRQRGSKPVAFAKDGVLFWHGEHASWRGFNGDLYLAPQPAEPVKLECPKCGADRSKVPCAGELMNCHFKGEAQSAEPVNAGSQWDKDKWEHRMASQCLDRMGVRAHDPECHLSLWGRIVAAFEVQGLVIEQPLTGPYVVRPAEPVKVPSDLDILDVWQEFREFRPDWICKFARTLLARYGQPAALTEWEQRADIEAEQERLKPAASAEPAGIVRWRNANAVVDWNGRPPEDGTPIYTTPVAAQAQKWEGVDDPFFSPENMTGLDKDELIRQLQWALNYWMPSIAGDGTPDGERCANDSYLLYGMKTPVGREGDNTPSYWEKQQPSAQDREDAERYRLLRRGQHWSVINGIGEALRADSLDAAIDAARAAKEES